ncbi:ADP-glyceromanno-heptose 6-epimerase precursor [Syntrophus gentianae]|uniref:ADP-L-glycero-D-manno-heptose-6-epimerase n=1 Tax=Syntrophus gentianae TaxID=43775 RepID=A0A1H7VKP6_9BACT|nr:ADP-glyceromanno-heptose 6-epimerase [Syntrophus gentianae]SEM09730.1 ADP-glyceromanno-heptose 6-epimerase precursor [Syntrophus gentianae]
MFIVTGGAGFIGSAFVWKLNSEGINDILIVDNLGESDKWKNLVNRSYADYVHKEDFRHMLEEDILSAENIEAVIHMGACSSTTERDADYLMENNFHYTCDLAQWAVSHDIRFVYASSAATYGNGSLGFDDDLEGSRRLRPINMYGYSKQLFDQWAIRHGLIDRIVGVKFFNVFGPNEYHKGDMTSVVFKSFHQIMDTGRVRLFKSHSPDYADGGQMRDFVYVKDCVDVLWQFVRNPGINGIFNLGTGRARTWNDLVNAVFAAMNLPPCIDYIDMPESLRGQYQYFTEARMEKLQAAGVEAKFHALEEAVADYVKNHLQAEDPHL